MLVMMEGGGQTESNQNKCYVRKQGQWPVMYSAVMGQYGRARLHLVSLKIILNYFLLCARPTARKTVS